MNSVKILENYFSGQVERKQTRTLLKEYESNAIAKAKAQAKCACGLFVRYTMYKEGSASAIELLLKLRDFILFVSRIKCGNAINEIVNEYGISYGLYLDPEGYVNASLKLPDWFHDKNFVENTYRFTHWSTDTSKYDVGDVSLTNATKKHKTYKSFEQKTAVQAALMLPLGYTMLASLPTGGGKSAITQMVSYYSEGLTVVVVPTVALAMDQQLSAIETLNDEFSSHIFYYAGKQKDEEYARIINGIKKHEAKLLFISPEALLKNAALNKMLDTSAAEGYLKNIVIDEAHIVPDWGVIFRPDFQILSFVIKRWRSESGGQLRTYLLSATLPDDTVDVLKTLFSEEDKFVEYRCDALRREPQFCFYESKNSAQRLNHVEQLIVSLPKPMIIYFLEPGEVVSFKKHLENRGYKNVRAFHGDTKEDERMNILQDWKNDRCDVIVATSAFGIGVDKSDVRTVIHACVPENLSRFYQEVGRAGRDGNASLSVFMPYTGQENSDSERAYSLVRGRVLRVDTMVNRWNGLIANAFVDGDTVDFDTAAVPGYFTDEAAQYAGERNSNWNINLLLFLHRAHYIEIQDAYFKIESKSYHFRAKVLKVDEMSSIDSMHSSLCGVRESELRTQLDGYFKMRELVLHPNKRCWGHKFHEIYPLSTEICNGCPKHRENTFAIDDTYRVRKHVTVTFEPAIPSKELKLAMRNAEYLLIRNSVFPNVNIENLRNTASIMNSFGIKTIVGSQKTINNIDFEGLKLNKDEFNYLVEMFPGLFYCGVFAIFDDDQYANSTLYNSLSRLAELGYKNVLYCSDDMYVYGVGKRITDFLDCKIRNADDLV